MATPHENDMVPGEKKVLAHINKSLRKIDSAPSWVQQLIGVIRKIREGLLPFASIEFQHALAVAYRKNQDDPIWRFYFMYATERIRDGMMITIFDQRYAEIYERLRLKHGLRDDEEWELEHRPEDVRHVDDMLEKEDVCQAIKLLRNAGINELADLCESDPPAYDALYTQGRLLIFPE